jgi:DNA-binding GntR family transcriptional regulator
MRSGLLDTTLASKVYERVRRGIVSGELQPGQPMSRRRIATELRTSPLPVASAFQRLEFEGLLESRPRAGTRVRAVSLNDVRDHFVVWEALETQVAMRVALMATALELKQLGTLAEELDNSQLAARQYSLLHSAFHRQVAEYSRCPALYDAVDRCHAFAMLWLSQVAQPRGLNTRHQQLVAAIASRDPMKAAHEASQHLSFGIARAIEALSSDSHDGERSGRPIFKRQQRKQPSARRGRQTR